MTWIATVVVTQVAMLCTSKTLGTARASWVCYKIEQKCIVALCFVSFDAITEVLTKFLNLQNIEVFPLQAQTN